jgi:hypothetical protein
VREEQRGPTRRVAAGDSRRVPGLQGTARRHAAVRQGAAPEEVAEAIGVTFLMNGGPAIVYHRLWRLLAVVLAVAEGGQDLVAVPDELRLELRTGLARF